MTEFNDRIRAAREAKGLGRPDVWKALDDELAGLSWSISTLERIETKTPEQNVEPYVLSALAHLYEVPLEDLSPIAAQRIARMVSAGRRHQAGSESRWFPTSPGQRPRRKRRRGEKHIDLAKRQRPVKVMLTAA